MYKWDDFLSGLFATDIGVGQGSGLSPVLSGLYIGPVIKLFSLKPSVAKARLSDVLLVALLLSANQTKSQQVCRSW